MSEWTIMTLRAALVRSRGVFGRPYPAMARAAALEWAERRQREGVDLQSIASDAWGQSNHAAEMARVTITAARRVLPCAARPARGVVEPRGGPRPERDSD